jgi:cbb3-type cytochrome oxidase cytochrome c subunit
MIDTELKAAGLRPYCACQSGEYREAQYDARGIFLTYTCRKCHRTKMQGFRADVLTDTNYWTDEDI